MVSRERVWRNVWMVHRNKKDTHERFAVQVGAKGRLVLPAPVRRQLGVSEGDRLMLTIQADGTVRLASLRDEIRKARGMLRHLAPGRSLADELIAERREQARKDDGM